MKTSLLWASLFLPGVLQTGCSGGAIGSGDENLGVLQASLQKARLIDPRAMHDVVAVRFDVGVRDQPCVPAMISKIVPLGDEPLPPSFLADGSGVGHPSSDAFFVIAPGRYNVCATPLTQGGGQSIDCSTADSFADVSSGETAEVAMTMPCVSVDNGAIDAVGALNTAPVIDNIIFDPGKFIRTNEVIRITVVATDPDGDALRFNWESSDGQSSVNQTFVFQTSVQGTLRIKVTVIDPFDARTSLSFDVHVSGPADAGTD